MIAKSNQKKEFKMDSAAFTTAIGAITMDTGNVLAMGLAVITAYSLIWAVRKVIGLTKA